MNPLKPADLHHLRAAEGWLELGNVVEAREELDQISTDRLDHPDVLEISWILFAKEQNWNACVKAAELLVQQAPERPGGWIHRSFALHELKRTEEALNNLNKARRIFSDEWVIPYNLACYLTQLGRIKEAARELHTALKINPRAVKHAAVNVRIWNPCANTSTNCAQSNGQNFAPAAIHCLINSTSISLTAGPLGGMGSAAPGVIARINGVVAGLPF
jgi:tetratricopeptide (TPR) repeat protein